MGAPTSVSQDIIPRMDASCSSPRAVQRTAKASRYSMRRNERYREAEARLLKSFRHCQQEPSPHDLQLRALELAQRTLSQLAEESSREAKKLRVDTIDRATVAALDPGSFRSILSQRWRAERRQDFISHHIEVLQQTITSLKSPPAPLLQRQLPISSGSGIGLTHGGHEGNQVPDSEDKTCANLVSYLGCSQRVVPLHFRSRSRSPKKIYPRPLLLNAPSAVTIAVPTASITNSLITTTTTAMAAMTTTTTTHTDSSCSSSNDSSLDMHVETPVIADSLAEQQAQLKFMINEGQAGTAIIHSRPLLPAAPLNPSDVEVELPDYVHELLADFDAQGNTLSSATTLVEFQREVPKRPRSRGLWPFKTRHGSRTPKSGITKPELRTKTSLKRLSGFLSSPEMLTLRKKVNMKEGEGSLTTTTSASGTESGDDGDATPQSRNSSSAGMVAKVTSRLGRGVSAVTSKR